MAPHHRWKKIDPIRDILIPTGALYGYKTGRWFASRKIKPHKAMALKQRANQKRKSRSRRRDSKGRFRSKSTPNHGRNSSAGSSRLGMGPYSRSRSGAPSPGVRSSSSNQHARGAGIPGTISKYSEFHKLHSKWGKLANVLQQPCYYYTDGKGELASGYNLQGSFDLCLPYRRSDVITLMAASPTNVVTPYTVGNSYNTQRILLEQVDVTFFFTNQANMVSHLDIYDIAMKSLQADVANYRSPNDWFTAAERDAEGVGASVKINRVGVKPDMFPEWKRYWKIKGRHHIILDGNGTHEHQYTYRPNKVFRLSDLQGSSGDTSSMIPGLSRGILAIYYGSATNDGGTRTNIGMGATDIDYTYIIKYKYKYIYASDFSKFTLPSSTWGTITSGVVMKEDDSNAVAEATAGAATV